MEELSDLVIEAVTVYPGVKWRNNAQIMEKYSRKYFLENKKIRSLVVAKGSVISISVSGRSQIFIFLEKLHEVFFVLKA